MKNRFGIDWGQAGSNVYSGTAEFGKDMTTIITVLTLIVATFMIIGGTALFFKNPVYFNQIFQFLIF